MPAANILPVRLWFLPRKTFDKSKPIRVALTGGTGFSGGYILPQLIAAGYDVVALARKPEVLAGKCRNVVAGDLSDATALAKLVEQADVVLHVGGATSAQSRESFFDVNVEGTKRLFRAARQAQVSRFVYVSSLTAREPDLLDYGASKAAAEKFLLDHDDEDCDILILRPPAVYGPGDRAALPLFKLLQQNVAVVPGHKSSRFSLLHVSDFAKVVCESVEYKSHGIFELDDQTMGYTWADLAETSTTLTGKPIRTLYMPYGLLNAAAGVAEAIAKLTGHRAFATRQDIAKIYHKDWVVNGWLWPIAQPIKLHEGFAQTLVWYQQQGWLPPQKERVRSPA